MYFGEYLINKKVIDENQLLEALSYQLEHLPSFLRVLRDENLFSAKEIVRFIQIQMECNSDLITVLRDEQKIDEIKLQYLFEKQINKRQMLGSVLVELNIISQAVMDEQLYDFFNDKENLKLLSNKEKVIPGLKKPEAIVEISEAALESLRELGLSDESFVESPPKVVAGKSKVDNVFVDQYLNTYNEKLNKKLEKLMKMIADANENDILNYYNSFYRDIFILKGAAILAELKFSATLFEIYGSLIEKKILLTGKDLKTWTDHSLSTLQEGLFFLWEVRGDILKDHHEEKVNASQELSTKYQKIISSLELIK